MKILIACEFSQIITNEFRKLGHDAYSCDIIPTEGNSDFHIQGDVLDHLSEDWDLMIAHPPCTFLAVSGARWFADRTTEQTQALDFVQKLMDAPIPKIAIENPISIISTHIKSPDQIIQPYQFGHGEQKATCLWLKNLPMLSHTSNTYNWGTCKYENIITERKQKIAMMGPSKDRAKNRSRTYPGIAKAMALQWSNNNKVGMTTSNDPIIQKNS